MTASSFDISPQSSHGSTMAFVSSFPCLFGRGSPSSAFFSLFHRRSFRSSAAFLLFAKYPSQEQGPREVQLAQGRFRSARDRPGGHLRGFLGSSWRGWKSHVEIGDTFPVHLSDQLLLRAQYISLSGGRLIHSPANGRVRSKVASFSRKHSDEWTTRLLLSGHVFPHVATGTVAS